MKLKSLEALRRRPLEVAPLASLPTVIRIAAAALAKALKINELVREIHGRSYEWYGFTLGERRRPEIIIDVGLPANEVNAADFTSINATNIARYQEGLDPALMINGWVHSHGNLDYRRFSDIDARNQLCVLDYVTSLVKVQVAKREVRINDLTLLRRGHFGPEDLRGGSVALITDAEVQEAMLMEGVVGGYCFALLVGDGGWHHQEIFYKHQGILSGEVEIERRETDLQVEGVASPWSPTDVAALAAEVRSKIRPLKAEKPETIERL